MKKLLSVVVAVLVSIPVFAKEKDEDLPPDLQIGRLYCYGGWNEETKENGHVLLTDRYLRKERVRGGASLGYSVRPGTRVVDIWIDAYGKPYWDIRYSDLVFYKDNKGAALECVKKLCPHLVEKFPVHFKEQTPKKHLK